MRFTKIPLIATLMAVALSLLIVLPTLAQTTADRTDGQLKGGDNITVGVFANIGDARLAKLEDGGQDDEDGNNIFIPLATTPATPANDVGLHAPNEAAWLMSDTSSPQDTLFRNTLYISNDVSAYNTGLINFVHPTGATTAEQATCITDLDNNATATANVTATVKNNRSGRWIVLELAQTSTAGNSEAFFKVVHEDIADYVDDNDTPDDTSDDAAPVPYREFNGPTFCADTTTTVKFDTTPDNADDALQDVANETVATSARYYPVDYSRIATTGLRPAAQEIGTIFARHGDRLTVTVSGTSGSVDLTVDGEGPEFSAVTPEDNAVTRPNRLTFSFEVRDDDSGLRHDGEAVITADGDYKEVNADDDHQRGDEPLSVDPGASVDANGRAADIEVLVMTNDYDPATDFTAATHDMSASGEWRMAGSRAGVAYTFTAGGADKDDGPYLYQLEAKDRAGNVSMTDADADTTGDAPYVFRVDDTDPTLTAARTGITYDTAKNVEKVDRSYIALTFGTDALGDVDTSNITVVGHTIESVIHPTKAPVINRDTPKVTTAPTGSAPPAPGNAPTVVTDPSTRTPVVAQPAAPVAWDNTYIGLTASDANYLVKPTANTLPTQCTDANDCSQWKAWIAYETYVHNNRVYVDKKKKYDDYNQYSRENPGRDIENGWIAEPRSRIYLELGEDLASDATPTVVVVGGAVYDLAGNTNDAKTLDNEVEDWIAPGLTVTVTGTAADRAVANTKGSFKVGVRSDEDMDRRPVVYFVEIHGTNAGADTDTTTDDVWSYEITEHATNDNVDRASNLTQQEDENHWAKTYKVSSIEDHFDGLIGVIVVGQDESDNIGATAGWTEHPHQRGTDPDVTPDEGDKLDPSKLHGAGLLVEIDKQFNKGEKESTDGVTIGTVTPRSDKDGMETESANPFVKLSFGSEGKEYTVGTFKDSHARVTVTEIKLNDVSAMADLNRVSSTEFSLVTRDLAVGDYTVEYKAEDDAGNEYEDKFEFEVKERQPYEIDVQPGWNLVSLPATPLEPAIGDVLAGNGYITPVLGYQQGDWITAVREEDGTWRGRLTEIVGGYGYWVHARTFESIETMLAEADPAATLPTVPVTAGWNLLGVLDIFQNDAGDAPGAEGGNGDEADNYFSSIPWRVAYTYDTTKSLWIKDTPGDPAQADEILNGNGYWVWSPSPSTLAP